MTVEQKNKFLELAEDLSPENLTCDGEASASWVRSRVCAIRAEWRKLEKEVGRTVTEDEVWEEVTKAWKTA